MAKIPRPQISSFIWTDKLAIGLTIASAYGWAALWLLAFLAIGSEGTRHLWSFWGFPGTNIGLLGLISLWLAMRAIDFVVGGRTYRLFSQIALNLRATISKAGRGPAKLARHHGPQTAG